MTLYPVKQKSITSIKTATATPSFVFKMFLHMFTCHRDNMVAPQKQPVGWEEKARAQKSNNAQT